MTLEKLDVSDCRSLKVLPNLPNPFRYSNLRKSGCKIIEIKGMFKLEPLGNVDPEIISEMGLSSELETMGSLEMVELHDVWIEVFESQKKGPLQLILEAGDEVKVSVGSTYDENCLVNEIGVKIVYDEPEDSGSQHRKTYSSHQDVTPVGDLSGYQVIPGHYLLCNLGRRKAKKHGYVGRRNYIEIYHRDEIYDTIQIIFWGFSDSEEDTAGSWGFSSEESARLTDEE
ncbi:hypothetical protein Vadar_034444 [Vaccinium darrowii]|uniref:Uncharacterized protein n=1 Tax=Vaccinium darrowii TaxID=229202 RepID=A0ACB7ZPL1_9ERIC|nr:hypothetical protein Vadar_034444 [Vaccinium darrowii]